MRRPVVVMNSDIDGYRMAIPLANIKKAREWVAELILATVVKHEDTPITVRSFKNFEHTEENEWDVFPERSFLLTDETGNVWIRVFITEDGKEGVYLGFDSGDRDNFVGQLPLKPENPGEEVNYGDADAYLFRTKGVKSGTAIFEAEVR